MTARSPERVYGTRQSAGWTRIGMLLALYDAGLQQLDLALDALRRNQHEQLQSCRAKAQRIVFGLAAGLDLSQGDLPRTIARLCEFMSHQLAEGTEASLMSARTVMANLRDGYEAIQQEAVRLEAEGKIQPLEYANSLRVTV